MSDLTLAVWFANKFSMVEPTSQMRTSSDVPVVRLDDLLCWIESKADAFGENGLHVCIDTLIAEVLERKRMTL